MNKIIEVGQDKILVIEVIMEIIWEVTQGMGDKIIIETDSEVILEIKVMKETGVDHMVGRLWDNNRRDDRSVSNSRSRSGLRASTNRGRIRCFECWEYDHFTRDCPTTQTDREVEQIQQLFNMDKDQTLLQMPLMDVDQVRQSVSLTEAWDNLNL